jgi:hypothetical protein
MHQPQRRENYVPFAIEVVGKHAGRAARFFRDISQRHGFQATLDDGLTGSERDFVSSCIVIDDFWHFTAST